MTGSAGRGRPHQELLAEAERRLCGGARRGPARAARFALRVAGRARRPAVARRPRPRAPRAYGPLAI